MFWQSRTDRAGRTQAKSRTTARWPKSRIALQTALDVFGCFAEQDKALQTATGFSDVLRVATGFRMLSGPFLNVFRCFAKQDKPSGVYTDYKALAKDLEESSRSQGTITNPRGDVYGRVSWSTLKIT